MGRRKSSGGEVVGILVLGAIAIALKFWIFIVIGLVLYFLIKAMMKSGESTGESSYVASSNTSGSSVFYNESTSLQINGYQVPAYLLYVSDKSSNLPHVVNKNLHVSSEIRFTDSIEYYPKYGTLSADQRAKFLNWLKDGRIESGIDIGYVFIYFYGLEYRAVKENKDHLLIFNELVRLHSIYSYKNSSFKSYSQRLIGWLIASNQDWNLGSFDNREIFNQLSEADLPLGHLVQRLYPHSVVEETCLRILEKEFYQMIPFKSIEAEAFALFKILTASMKTSLCVSPVKRNHIYISCSGERFQSSLSLNILKITSEAKAMSLVEECVSQLKEYGIKKNGKDLLASLDLPRGLQSSFCSPTVEKLKNELIKLHLISVSDLMEKLEIPKKASVGITNSRRISKVASNLGLRIEPDFEITEKIYKESDKIVIELKEADMETKFKPANYLKAVTLFDLSMSIAMADGELNEHESDHVLKYVTTSFKLSPEETQRLKMRILLIKDGSIKLGPLIKKVSVKLTLKDLKVIAHFLFSIASMDGVLDGKEAKLLDKTFKQFGLPDDHLNTIIAEHATKNGKPVLLKEANSNKKKGSAIPQEIISKSVAFDEEALKAAFAETEEVSRILSRVFTEPAEAEEVIGVEVTPIEQVKLTLKPKVKDLLDMLLTKSSWECSEIEDKCREFGLMYGSTINSINNWSEEVHGDFLLEDDGSEIIVNAEIMNEGVKIA